VRRGFLHYFIHR